MHKLNGKRVLIIQQRGWARVIGIPLGRELSRLGCKLGAVTIKKSTHEAILKSGTNYEFIFLSDRVKEDPSAFVDQQATSLTLDGVCKALGIETMWELAQASRYHVKSYRDKYYFGFKQEISDQQIRDFFIAIFQYTRKIFDEFKPDLVITPNFAGLQHLIINKYAAQCGIPMLGFFDTKIPGITVMTTSYNATSGRFIDRIKELNQQVRSDSFFSEAQDLEKIREGIVSRLEIDLKENGTRSSSWKYIVQRELRPWARALLFYLRARKDQLANQHVTLDDQTPFFILRDHFMGKWYARMAERFSTKSLDGLREFVYFPLQVQPEATIDILAPRFNNQIETARQIAMSLPGDLSLVVKDHPSMRNKRSPNYLEKIARTPNVILVSSRLSAAQILSKARLVITPGGTIAFEASVLHVPVIQLGSLGTTRMLPNVHYHQDMNTLSGKIREVLAASIDTASSNRRIKNYIQAGQETGFDLNYYEIAEHRQKPQESEVSAICHRIVEELTHYIE